MANVEYRLDGTVRYKGFWKDGKKHGSGKYIRKDGSVQYYGTSTNDRMTERAHTSSQVVLPMLVKS